LFSGEGGGKCAVDGGLKVGYTKMQLTKELQLPNVTTNQRIAFGILCALEVYHLPEFTKWANDWLSGKDRTWAAASAARAEASAARAEARAEAWAAAAASAARAAWAAAGMLNLPEIAHKAMEVK
jgi:hypothetical protein